MNFVCYYIFMTERFKPHLPTKKESGRFKKLVRAGALAAGLLGSTTVGAQEQEVVSQDTEWEESVEKQQKINDEEIAKTKEEYWLKLPTREILERLSEYLSQNFVEHVLEYHLEKTRNSAINFVEYADFLKPYIGYRQILRRAVETAMEDEFYCSYLLQPKLIANYSDLENYTNLLERAAEKTVDNDPEQVVFQAEGLFTHLPHMAAEHYFLKAIYKLEDRPQTILSAGVNIKKYIPEAQSYKILSDAADKGLQQNAILFFVDFYRWGKEKVFSPEKLRELAGQVIWEDPEYALSFLDNEQGESFLKQMILESNSFLLGYLYDIARSSLTNSGKETAATFIEIMMQENLSPEDTIKKVGNTKNAKKLAEEILSNPKCIGRQSLSRFLRQFR